MQKSQRTLFILHFNCLKVLNHLQNKVSQSHQQEENDQNIIYAKYHNYLLHLKQAITHNHPCLHAGSSGVVIS